MSAPKQTRQVLGHVNLMIDTLIANACEDDLRAIVRTMVARGSPSVTQQLTTAARTRYTQPFLRSRPPKLGAYFTRKNENQHDEEIRPAPKLGQTLSFARSLFGSGLGFESLEYLYPIVHAVTSIVAIYGEDHRYRWEEDGAMANALAVIDGDLSQAIQSCREQVGSGTVRDIDVARIRLKELKEALRDCEMEVVKCQGEFPFERGALNASFLDL